MCEPHILQIFSKLQGILMTKFHVLIFMSVNLLNLWFFIVVPELFQIESALN